LFTWVLEFFVPTIILMSVVVFVHEWGHFWVARRNNVKVEDFAIGFGPELFGFSDKKGTRWAFRLVPLGGYIKMLGDADATSATADDAIITKLTEEERKQTLHAKTPWQRIQVAAGGPLANFVFAIVAMIGLFAVFGEPITPPVIGFVDPAGVGAKHGLQENDRILEINHEKIHSFENMLPFIRSGKHEVLSIKLERAKKQVHLNIPLTLKNKETGEIQKIKVLGIKPNPSKEYKKVSFGAAVQKAFSTFWGMCKTIVVGLGELLTGQRKGDELGGILAIGDMASQSAKLGVAGMLWFMIIMSINLGLINLFPIPVLDGGQMLMTSIEWVIGKPLPEKVQKYIFGSGFALVISLMLYSTWNDIVRFNVIQKICSLFQIVRGWLPL